MHALSPQPSIAAAPQFEPSLVVLQDSRRQAARTQIAERGDLNRRRLLSSTGLGLAYFACGCPKPALADGANTGMWDYSQSKGPKSWGGSCNVGVRQSPIDLPAKGKGNPKKKVQAFRQLALDYSTSALLYVKETGHHNLEVDVPEGSHATVGSTKYQLLQWHFHTPSEHAFGGKREAMEAHIVHRNSETGEICVLGVLLRRGGAKNLKALDVALKGVQQTKDGELPRVDIATVLQELLHSERNGQYINYSGSLTTPNCSEGVRWFVSTDIGSVTDSQVLDFQSMVEKGMTLGMNSRPLTDYKPELETNLLITEAELL